MSPTLRPGAVVHVVPRLPPPPEGVGSFALALAAALRERQGIDSVFLEGGTAGGAEGLAARLAELATANAVLLHYANYGYEPRGCPAWLVDGLAGWKARTGGRLVTVFHEVYASGPPWRSSFWLSPVQRRLAAALARLSEGLATSMGLYRRMLHRWEPDKKVALLPVFSTVGEPAAVPPLAGRARRLVVFGGPGVRRRAYARLRPVIDATCRALELEEVWDVGPEADPAEGAPRLAVPVRRLGALPEAEVSGLLLGSAAGFVSYPAPFLAKSTIFAAYCAHGVLPVCAWPTPRVRVEAPPPFWRPRAGAAVSRDELQETADRARAWYGGHTLDRHAAAYRELLCA